MSLRPCPTSALDVLLPVPSTPRTAGTTTIPIEQHDQFLVALRKAARDLAGRRSIRNLEETLRQIVASAVVTIPGVDAGSISITEHGRIATRHPTSEAVGKLDDTQSELGEGPCITAIEDPPPCGLVVAEDFAGADAERSRLDHVGREPGPAGTTDADLDSCRRPRRREQRSPTVGARSAEVRIEPPRPEGAGVGMVVNPR